MTESEDTGHGKAQVHMMQSAALGSPLLLNILVRMPTLAVGVIKRVSHTTCLTRP